MQTSELKVVWWRPGGLVVLLPAKRMNSAWDGGSIDLALLSKIILCVGEDFMRSLPVRRAQTFSQFGFHDREYDAFSALERKK